MESGYLVAILFKCAWVGFERRKVGVADDWGLFCPLLLLTAGKESFKHFFSF